MVIRPQSVALVPLRASGMYPQTDKLHNRDSNPPCCAAGEGICGSVLAEPGLGAVDPTNAGKTGRDSFDGQDCARRAQSWGSGILSPPVVLSLAMFFDGSRQLANHSFLLFERGGAKQDVRSVDDWRSCLVRQVAHDLFWLCGFCCKDVLFTLLT